MKASLEELQSRLEQLCSRRDRLADHLETVAERLSQHGERPPDRLVDDLTEYRSEFQSVASELGMAETDEAGSNGIDLSLDDLQRRLEWEHRVTQAITVLDRAVAITRTDGTAAEELSIVRDDVQILRQRLTSWPDVDPQAVNELAADTHPLCDLLRLADPNGSMADEDWNTAIENVRDVYGKAVATSSARGRLCRGDLTEHQSIE